VNGYIDERSQVAENVKMFLDVTVVRINDVTVVRINIEDELSKSRLRKDELFTFLWQKIINKLIL